jgi:thiol-disulfide isomerase/thioredoxin
MKILLSLLIFVKIVLCKEVILYDPPKDSVELLDVTTFDSTVFNSSKVTLIEFFAHWCGTCQRFAPRKQYFSVDLVSFI